MNNQTLSRLELLPKNVYVTLPRTDPLIYYYLPIIGGMYRKRVELALNECSGGEKILEVGYGSGVAFPNLKKKYQQIYGIDLYANSEQVTEMWNQYGIKPNLREGTLLKLPYGKEIFDTVLLISILEHIHPHEQPIAMDEISRVLKPGGQVVHGVPFERTLMVFMYRLLGVNIREHHFSTERDVSANARKLFNEKRLITMKGLFGPVYQVGHFVKPSQ